MLTHRKFTEFKERDGYKVRASIDAPYDRVFEVVTPHGTGHIEVRINSSFVRVTNGPLFFGNTTYVASVHKDYTPVTIGEFKTQEEAEQAIVNAFK